jgi:hypothetical protein
MYELIDTLVMMAALIGAAVWIIIQQRTVSKQHKQMIELALRVRWLEAVLFDVANGEADVWIEDDELRGARRTPRNTSLH